MERRAVTCTEFTSICHELIEQVPGKPEDYQAILCPLRGGFFLSYFMSQRLGLPLLYLEISSYQGTEQGDLQVGLKPELAQGRFLLCDDIYDSGKTITYIHQMYPHVTFDTLCVVTKVKDAPVIAGLQVEEDMWVDFFWETM